MCSVIDIIKNIQLTNNQLNLLIKNLIEKTNNNSENVMLQDEIDQIIINTQTELIKQIASDYNINEKELSRKYLFKNKIDKKQKSPDNSEDISDDNDDDTLNTEESTTMQIIKNDKLLNMNSDNDDDDDAIIDLLVKNKVISEELPKTGQVKRGRKPGSKKKVETVTTSNKSKQDVQINTEPIKTQNLENIYKTMNIRGKNYLLKSDE
jgi:hypothetical protein